jgi:hypothetical protein
VASSALPSAVACAAVSSPGLQVFQPRRPVAFGHVHDDQPLAGDAGQVGGVPGDAGQVPQHRAGPWRPAQRAHQLVEALGHARPVCSADVEIVRDEAWTSDRLSERAAGLLRFLPPPSQAGDPAAYLAAHQPPPGKGDQHDR